MTALQTLFRLVLPVVCILLFSAHPAMAEAPASGDEGAETEASEHGGHGSLNFFDFTNKEAAPLVALLFNFAALVFIVYKLMKKPLGNIFKDRKEALVKALEEAEAAKAAADAAIAEARAKIDAIDKEMEAVRQGILSAAEKEAERLTAAAEARAARLAEDAKTLAAQEVSRMAEAARREAVERIVAEATNIIREKITDADRDNLSSKYLTELGRESQSRVEGK